MGSGRKVLEEHRVGDFGPAQVGKARETIRISTVESSGAERGIRITRKRAHPEAPRRSHWNGDWDRNGALTSTQVFMKFRERFTYTLGDFFAESGKVF